MPINNNELRGLMVQCPTAIRNVLLTEHQVALYDKIKDHGNAGMTTHELVGIQGISPENASAKLRRMFRLGYLNRTEALQPSGGTEFIYTAIHFP